MFLDGLFGRKVEKGSGASKAVEVVVGNNGRSAEPVAERIVHDEIALDKSRQDIMLFLQGKLEEYRGRIVRYNQNLEAAKFARDNIEIVKNDRKLVDVLYKQTLITEILGKGVIKRDDMMNKIKLEVGSANFSDRYFDNAWAIAGHYVRGEFDQVVKAGDIKK